MANSPMKAAATAGRPAADGDHISKRPQLSDDVAAYIRAAIMSGQYKAGEYIRLDRVASSLGISATPVREALLALRGQGFVELEPRKGFLVAPISSQDIRDMYFVQASIAAELARRSCREITPDELAGLEEMQSGLEEAAVRGEIDAVETINDAFHSRINAISDSDKLRWLLSVTLRYVPRRFYATIPGWQDASVRDHRAILDAFSQRDEDKAAATMFEHIEHAGDLLVEHLRLDANDLTY